MRTARAPERSGEGPRPRAARPDDVFVVAGLVRGARPGCVPVSPREVLDHLGGCEVVADRRGRVVATASLRSLADGRLELRGLAVEPRWRGRGLGRRLVARAMVRAVRRGRTLVCVTRSPSFFAALGFEPIPLAAVPPKPDVDDDGDTAPRRAMALAPARTAARRAAGGPR